MTVAPRRHVVSPCPETIASAFRTLLRLDDTPTPVARIIELTRQMYEVYARTPPEVDSADRDRRVWRVGYAAARTRGRAGGRAALTCDDSSRLIAHIGRAVIWPASTFRALWTDDVVDVVTKAECSDEIIRERARDLGISFVEPDELDHAAALETIAAWQAAGDPPHRQRSTPRSRFMRPDTALGVEYAAQAIEVEDGIIVRRVSHATAATQRATTIALAADLERQRAKGGGR